MASAPKGDAFPQRRPDPHLGSRPREPMADWGATGCEDVDAGAVDGRRFFSPHHEPR